MATLVISFDNSAKSDPSTPIASGGTFSYTTGTGNYRYMIVAFQLGTGKTISSASYAGVALTQKGSYKTDNAGGHDIGLFYLVSPTSGTNNLTATTSDGSGFVCAVATYNNVNPVTPEAVNGVATTASPLSIAVTTVTDNAWVVGTFSHANSATGSFTAGANTTVRNTSTNCAIADTNAAQTPAGSHSLAVTFAGTNTGSAVSVSLAPVPPRYWVGGSGTWDTSDTTHWSYTSGGAGGADVPLSIDGVIFDGNSGTGTVTLGANVSCSTIDLLSYTGTLAFSTYTLTLAGTGTVWKAGAFTLTPGTGTIKLTDASSTSKTFSGGSLTYNNLWLTGAGTGTFIILGDNTFNDFKCDTPPHTIQFDAGSTQTLTTFTVNGTAGNLMTLQSTVSGKPWYLHQATTSTITCDYLSLQDSYVQ